jgi:hypothetical protein
VYAGLKGTDIRDIREIPLEEAGLIVDEARERTLLNETPQASVCVLLYQ